MTHFNLIPGLTPPALTLFRRAQERLTTEQLGALLSAAIEEHFPSEGYALLTCPHCGAQHVDADVPPHPTLTDQLTCPACNRPALFHAWNRV